MSDTPKEVMPMPETFPTDSPTIKREPGAVASGEQHAAEGRDTLIARLAELQPDKLAEALIAYAQWCGGVHDDGCPEDDTCECSGKWINDGVTAAINALPLLREAEARVRQPIDATGQGRLLLNEYGRKCYEAGEKSARAATDEALARLEQEMRDWTRHMLGSPSEMQAQVQRWADTIRALRSSAMITLFSGTR